MDRHAGISRSGRAAGLLAALAAAVLCWATPAVASDPSPAGAELQSIETAPESTVQRSADFERWRGRSCPLGGCGPAPGGRATTTLAFGAAVGTIAWVSRRRGSGVS